MQLDWEINKAKPSRIELGIVIRTYMYVCSGVAKISLRDISATMGGRQFAQSARSRKGDMD